MWMFYRRDHRGERGSRALEFSSRRGHLEIGNSSKRDFASTYRCVWKRLIEKKEKERNAPNFDAETRLDRICHSLRSILWFRSTPSSILAPINPQISWIAVKIRSVTASLKYRRRGRHCLRDESSFEWISFDSIRVKRFNLDYIRTRPSRISYANIKRDDRKEEIETIVLTRLSFFSFSSSSGLGSN